MQPEFWYEVMARLSGDRVVNVDDILELNDLSVPEEGPQKIEPARMLSHPCRLLWPQDRNDMLAIGIRISKPLSNPTDLAGQLAALAAERGIIPVILSGIGNCGLERFGFRIEDISIFSGQISGNLEDQIRQFWKIDIVIEAETLHSYS